MSAKNLGSVTFAKDALPLSGASDTFSATDDGEIDGFSAFNDPRDNDPRDSRYHAYDEVVVRPGAVDFASRNNDTMMSSSEAAVLSSQPRRSSAWSGAYSHTTAFEAANFRIGQTGSADPDTMTLESTYFNRSLAQSSNQSSSQEWPSFRGARSASASEASLLRGARSSLESPAIVVSAPNKLNSIYSEVLDSASNGPSPRSGHQCKRDPLVTQLLGLCIAALVLAAAAIVIALQKSTGSSDSQTLLAATAASSSASSALADLNRTALDSHNAIVLQSAQLVQLQQQGQELNTSLSIVSNLTAFLLQQMPVMSIQLAQQASVQDVYNTMQTAMNSTVVTQQQTLSNHGQLLEQHQASITNASASLQSLQGQLQQQLANLNLTIVGLQNSTFSQSLQLSRLDLQGQQANASIVALTNLSTVFSLQIPVISALGVQQGTLQAVQMSLNATVSAQQITLSNHTQSLSQHPAINNASASLQSLQSQLQQQVTSLNSTIVGLQNSTLAQSLQLTRLHLQGQQANASLVTLTNLSNAFSQQIPVISALVVQQGALQGVQALLNTSFSTQQTTLSNHTQTLAQHQVAITNTSTSLQSLQVQLLQQVASLNTTIVGLQNTTASQSFQLSRFDLQAQQFNASLVSLNNATSIFSQQVPIISTLLVQQGNLQGALTLFNATVAAQQQTLTNNTLALVQNQAAISSASTSLQSLQALQQSNLFPSGTIVMWSGTIESIPTGFALCNGSNGTPDLRGSFVMGAGTNDAVGRQGGAAAVALNLSHLPAHSHNATSTFQGSPLPSHGHAASDSGHTHNFYYQVPSGGQSMSKCFGAWVGCACNAYIIAGTLNNCAPQAVGDSFANVVVTSASAGTPSGTVTTNTSSVGSGASFSTLPPYFSLAYVMKV